MELIAKRKLLVGAAATLLVAGSGAAVAANRLGSPKDERDAVVADAAKQLGIAPAKLSAALETALKNRVDAAVAAGRLSKDEGAELKARIESGEFPLFLGHPRHRLGHPGPKLDAAATYLGLTRVELRSELDGGKTLAQIAVAHGKTADGIVQALLDQAKERIDAAVRAGRLTQTDADDLLLGLKARISDLVNGRFPHPDGFRHTHGFRGFRGGPPPPLFGP